MNEDPTRFKRCWRCRGEKQYGTQVEKRGFTSTMFTLKIENMEIKVVGIHVFIFYSLLHEALNMSG